MWLGDNTIDVEPMVDDSDNVVIVYTLYIPIVY